MREKTVEAKLAAAVKAMGGLSPKYIGPGYDGMPDHLALLLNGIPAFAAETVLHQRASVYIINRENAQ